MLVVVESDVTGEMLEELREKFTDKEIAVLTAGYKALIRFQHDNLNENYDTLSQPLQREVERLKNENIKLITG
jgi:hypothetical protein